MVLNSFRVSLSDFIPLSLKGSPASFGLGRLDEEGEKDRFRGRRKERMKKGESKGKSKKKKQEIKKFKDIR